MSDCILNHLCRATSLQHRRRVAVEVMLPQPAILCSGRFLKEIELTANLRHLNILPLYDSGEAHTVL